MAENEEKKQPDEKEPFFSKLLETQKIDDPGAIKGGEENQIPKEGIEDTVYVTMKYPSDNDEMITPIITDDIPSDGLPPSTLA